MITVEGRTLREIADRTGLPVALIYQRYARKFRTIARLSLPLGAGGRQSKIVAGGLTIPEIAKKFDLNETTVRRRYFIAGERRLSQLSRPARVRVDRSVVVGTVSEKQIRCLAGERKGKHFLEIRCECLRCGLKFWKPRVRFLTTGCPNLHGRVQVEGKYLDEIAKDAGVAIALIHSRYARGRKTVRDLTDLACVTCGFIHQARCTCEKAALVRQVRAQKPDVSRQRVEQIAAKMLRQGQAPGQEQRVG